jgi:hypothetical protein
MRPAGLASSPSQTPQRASHRAVSGPRFCSTRTAYTAVRRASEIRSVPAGTASRCSSRRSDDGQTILRSIAPTYNKPLTCTPSRDGGIRTRGLLLPKPEPTLTDAEPRRAGEPPRPQRRSHHREGHHHHHHHHQRRRRVHIESCTTPLECRRPSSKGVGAAR